jgi:hypothetical protein
MMADDEDRRDSPKTAPANALMISSLFFFLIPASSLLFFLYFFQHKTHHVEELERAYVYTHK